MLKKGGIIVTFNSDSYLPNTAETLQRKHRVQCSNGRDGLHCGCCSCLYIFYSLRDLQYLNITTALVMIRAVWTAHTNMRLSDQRHHHWATSWILMTSHHSRLLSLPFSLIRTKITNNTTRLPRVVTNDKLTSQGDCTPSIHLHYKQQLNKRNNNEKIYYIQLQSDPLLLITPCRNDRHHNQ